MQLFYSSTVRLDALVQLDEQEAHHAVKVLRKSIGDTIHLFDGTGNVFAGEIVQADKKGVVVKVLAAEKVSSQKANIHLAVALPKNAERLEWMLEKVTEIGVKEITPLICRYSERKDFKRERCEKILISACKQSKNLFLPKLNEPILFTDWIKQKSKATRLIAWCEEKTQHIKELLMSKDDVEIAIGPEGDFSKEEIDAALHNGFVPVSLGKSRLRLETAALYAVVVLNAWKE